MEGSKNWIREKLQNIDNRDDIDFEEKINLFREDGIELLPPPYPWDALPFIWGTINCIAYATNLAASQFYHGLA